MINRTFDQEIDESQFDAHQKRAWLFLQATRAFTKRCAQGALSKAILIDRWVQQQMKPEDYGKTIEEYTLEAKRYMDVGVANDWASAYTMHANSQMLTFVEDQKSTKACDLRWPIASMIHRLRETPGRFYKGNDFVFGTPNLFLIKEEALLGHQWRQWVLKALLCIRGFSFQAINRFRVQILVLYEGSIMKHQDIRKSTFFMGAILALPAVYGWLDPSFAALIQTEWNETNNPSQEADIIRYLKLVPHRTFRGSESARPFLHLMIVSCFERCISTSREYKQQGQIFRRLLVLLNEQSGFITNDNCGQIDF